MDLAKSSNTRRHLFTSVTLHFLWYGLLSCLCSSAGYGQSVLKLNHAEPKAGAHISFSYIGPLSKTLIPEFRVYFFNEGPLKWITLRAKHNQGKLTGDFKLPADALAFCIKPDKYKGVREAFAFSVYEGGKPLAGSRAGMAQFHYNFRRFIDIKDSLKAIELFREEFKQNPQLKNKFLLDYFMNGSYGIGSIGKEMVSTWADSVRTGRDEQFLYHLYAMVRDDHTVDLITKNRLRDEMLRLYPKGELAFNEDPNQKRRNDLLGLQMLESQYTNLVALGKLDGYYGYAVRMLFWNGNYVEGDRYLKKIRDAEKGEGLCRFASGHLVKSGMHLDLAASIAKEGYD